jgi:hypothetical protein
MSRKIKVIALFVLALCLSAAAAQKQELKIVPDPLAIGVKGRDSLIRIEWVQLAAAGAQSLVTPQVQGSIYFSATPAGGDLSRYTQVTALIDNNVPGKTIGAAQTRRSSFRPRSAGIGPGTYYCIIASVVDQDTLYSDYFILMVESPDAPEIISPKANLLAGELVTTITQLTPQFSWRRVAGVPYYHVILSDEPIIGGDGQLAANINVIWQAITPANSIAYGAPDPSGTLTTSPPPLSPGKTYSWIVLNNYGNHMAFNSTVINPADVLQGQFRIAGTPIAAPRVVSPAADTAFNRAPTIKFEWTNLAPQANSFLVNLFMATPAQNLGADLGTVKANLLVWETTVSRGNLSQDGVLSVELDAAGSLTTGDYTWRVYALDSRGAASTDSRSASSFHYTGPNGYITINTREMFGGEGGFESPVGFVELRTEVLSGPAQAPLAFFTDNNGDVISRAFPVGRYRITAVKEGYNAQSVTVDVGTGTTVVPTIYMVRPEATIYGQVLAAEDGVPVNNARVTAVSEWGDTLTAITGASGSFTISCDAASWTVTVERPGYRTSIPERVTLRIGDNRNFGAVRLVRNDHSLSGVVRNADGEPLIGARVRVLSAEIGLIDELASTPHNGMYAFYLNAGTYILTAEKAGFSMFSRTITVTGSSIIDITLPAGAALLNGVIVGKSWDAGRNDFVHAPVPSAMVRFWDSDGDTLTVTSDHTFGRFSISLPVGKDYSVQASAAGFTASASVRTLSTDGFGAGGGTMPVFTDTLTAFLAIGGVVSRQDGGPLGGVDVFVYDMNNRAVASARTSASGAYEVRNIRDNVPGEEYTVRAGSSGFYMVGEPIRLTVSGGAPEENRLSYNFAMDVGDKSIVWNIADWDAVGASTGVIKVVLPFNRTIGFDYRQPGQQEPQIASVSEVGPGEYLIEAVAESNPRLLELSYHAFNVSPYTTDTVLTVNFPFEHLREDTLRMADGRYELSVRGVTALPGVSVTTVELFFRSENRASFTRAVANISTAIPVDRIPFPVSFTPADGANLFYYFRVHLSDGRVYGSQKQLFRTFVRPEPTVISRISINPGVTGRDTLFLPSDYASEFTFGAFFSDQFRPIAIDNNVGAVEWFVYDRGGTRPSVPAGRGVSFQYNTPAEGVDMVLAAVFAPANSYRMKDGVSPLLEIPVRITGSRLGHMNVMRRGDVGPVSNTGSAGFRAQAFDRDTNLVTISPVWSLTPDGAGDIRGDGTFVPSSSFFGTARIFASVPGRSGLTAEYTEEGEAPGQVVFYNLRHSDAPATVDSRKGLRFQLPPRSIPADREARFDLLIPELKNYVHKSSDGYRMADTIAFDVTIGGVDAIDSAITIVLDIPARMRGTNQELRVARWLPDSLKWIPLESVNDGATVSAVLRNETRTQGQPRSAASAAGAQSRAAFGEHGRYALVTKTLSLSASMSISPHPFSPYIRPVREYARDYGAAGVPLGTCIKVNVEAPEASVRSLKVQIYNSTGTRVWAIDKLNAPAGENRFWWNGRTSGRNSGRTAVSEEVCTCNHRDCMCGQREDRPMLRNGRYFVKVIVTDLHGEQRRLMKPVVLMK